MFKVCSKIAKNMEKVTGEARVALMSKKDLRHDLMEEILSWVLIDKKCKSPVVDLIKNTENAPGQTGKALWSNQIDGLVLGRWKYNNFWMARKGLLNKIHMTDLHCNRHCNGYDSVFNESMKEYILRGQYKCNFRKDQQHFYYGDLQRRGLVNILEHYETNYDKRRYRAVRDGQQNIIGFKRIGVKNGKVISVISSLRND